jgi:hypothetical protein
MVIPRKRVRFGNWLPTTKATLGGLTVIGWGVLLTGVMAMVVFLVVGWWVTGLLTLVLALAVDAVFIIRWGDPTSGRTAAARILDRRIDAVRHKDGTNRYKTGLFTELPDEALTALPGMLAGLEEIPGVDGTGEEYVLLEHRGETRAPLLAATFSCDPDGTALLPQDQIDSQVSAFGGWIVTLSQDTAIEGAVIVVDSAQESTEPLVAKIDSEVSSAAPLVAQRQLMEGARALSGTYADVEVFASVVWNAKELADDVEDAAAEIGAKLPQHRADLAAAGAGSPVLTTSQDLARAVRVAYRPDRAREFGSDDLAGLTFRMKVTEAGPDEFDDSARRICYHDGVASMTAMMVAPPMMHITEDYLNRLFKPNGKFLRKRTAVFYRPLTPGAAVKAAKKLRDGARRSATAKGQPSEFDQYRQELAKATERDLVTGASMTAFAIEVTVTFEPTKRGIRDATQELKNILEGTGISYRFVETDTAAGFHSTLPLGMLPWAYATVAQTITDRTN